MSRNLSPAELNTRPLTESVDKAALKAWMVRMRRYPGYSEARPAPRIASGILLSLLALPLLGFWVAVVAGVVTGAFNWEAFSVAGVIVIIPALALVAALTFAALRGLTNYLKGFGQWKRWYLLHQFADANGLEFNVITDPSTMPGTIAAGGYKVTRDDYLVVPTEPGFEYGTVTRHTRTHQIAGSQPWAFIELRTPNVLPQIMLEVKGSKTRNYEFRESQRVALGDEFNKRFKLYAAKGGDAAALTIFSPEVLRTIDQNDHGFNFEVIEDRIVFHSVRLFDLAKPKEHQRVFRLANIVGRRLLANAALSTTAATEDATQALAGLTFDGTLEGGARTKTQMLRTRYSVSGTILGILVILTPIVMLIAGALM